MDMNAPWIFFSFLLKLLLQLSHHKCGSVITVHRPASHSSNYHDEHVASILELPQVLNF